MTAVASRTIAPAGSPLLAVALLLLAMASIQWGASLAKGLFVTIGATGAVCLRTAIATPLLLALLRPWRKPVRPTVLPDLLAYGAALGVMNLFYYLALRTLPLGITVAVEFTGPLAVAVAGSRRPRDLLWVGLAVAGLALLLPLRAGMRLDPVGLGCALTAGACWAAYIVYGQRAGGALGTGATAWGAVVAACLAVPVGLATAGGALLSPLVLPTGAAVAILSTALPYTIEMFALTRLPMTTFGVLMSLEPAFGALFGRVVLGERLDTGQWCAVALIMAASIGATLSAREAHQAGAVPLPE